MSTLVLQQENIEWLAESDGTLTITNKFNKYGAEYAWESFDESGNRISHTDYSQENTWYLNEVDDIAYIKAWVRIENGKKRNLGIPTVMELVKNQRLSTKKS